MSYIDNNLMPDERVTYRGKLHWIIFKWPVIWLVLALILFQGGPGNAGGGRLALILAVITGIGAFINYFTSEYAVTNKRIIVKYGFIKRRSLETLLSKVESLQVEQGIFGRILGYGTIVVTGTGGSKEPFKTIDAPFEFRKKVQEQVMNIQAV
jgi:uncharacterized membrane protein YdbT with pleckstrin-like domain